MKDMQGTELDNGQKVVFSRGTQLLTGVLQRVRITTSKYAGQNHRQIAVVLLDKPEKRFTQKRWVGYNFTTGITTYSGGDPRPDRLTREVYQENRILVIG